MGPVSIEHGTPCPADPKPNTDPKAIDPSKAAFFLSREERDRRARVVEATRRTLRDYDKYPLEDWEGGSA